jgi:outer membrane lipoprotein-sorting protein
MSEQSGSPCKAKRKKVAARTLLPIFIAVFLFAAGASAQTVDEIISHNIQAHGGLEKIETVKTIRTTGKFDAEGFRGNFLQENKRPDKVREETIIQGLAQVRAYDGTTGWQINPFGGRKDPALLSADDLKSLIEDADIDGQLVNYKQKGYTAELQGHDSMEGTDCYKIKLTLKNGDVRYYYLDTDSFLELKIEDQRTIRGTIQYSETYFGDYEKVDGIYYPFAFESGEKNNPDRVKYTVDKVEINVPLSDELFTMSASKPDVKIPGGVK